MWIRTIHGSWKECRLTKEWKMLSSCLVVFFHQKFDFVRTFLAACIVLTQLYVPVMRQKIVTYSHNNNKLQTNHSFVFWNARTKWKKNIIARILIYKSIDGGRRETKLSQKTFIILMKSKLNLNTAFCPVVISFVTQINLNQHSYSNRFHRYFLSKVGDSDRERERE